MAQTALASDDIEVVIDGDDDNSVHVDEKTGAIETTLPDGDVVVQLNPPAVDSDDAPDIKKFYENLVERVEAGKLGIICDDLMEQIQADDNSRKQTLDTRARGLGLLGLQLEQPKSGVGDSAGSADGMSVVTNPLLVEACLKAWANAQAELLPADGPCKVEDFDVDEPEANQELADSFERDMNFYLTTVASEYGPDTSHMLLWGTVFGGSGIKKVAVSPILRRPSSESVDVKDFIVSDTTKDLKSCERLTHQIPMRPSVMKRLQMRGFYREIPLGPAIGPEPNAVDQKIASIQGTTPNIAARPEDQPYTLWETQCELNLPEFAKPPYAPAGFADKGIALPFLVTIDKDSRTILALRRDWKPEDEECTRKQLYVKYPYIPGPGFYGTGLLNVLGNASAAMTAAWRLTLDAGMYANFPGGLVSEIGGRQKTNTLRPAPGEFTSIQTNGRPISEIVMALPYKDITPGLLALIDKITAQSEKAGGSAEVPVGEGIQNVPVGTMLAHIEQATKLMAAAHKGMHAAQSEELGLIADLFREDPESFWKGNKKRKKFWNEQKLFVALNTCTLVPKSDPNVPSHVHRLMKAVALVQLLQIPQFAGLLSPGDILDRVLQAMKEDPSGIRITPPPAQAGPPSPEMLTAAAKLKDADTKAQKVQVDAEKNATESQDRQAELASEKDIETVRLAQTLVAHAGDAKAADKTHALDANKHALNVAKTVHDASMDHANLALDTHQALNPPQPAGPTDSGQ